MGFLDHDDALRRRPKGVRVRLRTKLKPSLKGIRYQLDFPRRLENTIYIFPRDPKDRNAVLAAIEALGTFEGFTLHVFPLFV